MQTVPALTNGVATVVQLNGQPSQPSQGGTFGWRQTGGPSVTLVDASEQKATFLAPSVPPNGASLTFELTVQGCSPVETSTATTTVNVTYVASNLPPVAAIAVFPGASVNEGVVVTLDGSGSSDPEGDLLSYTWTQLEGPSVTLIPINGNAVTFIAPEVPYPNGASLKFRLTVSDDALSGTADQIVNVLWVNEPPVVVLACPPSVDERAETTLDGSASTDNDGDGIASYAWIQALGVPNADLDGVDLSGQTLTFTAPNRTSPLDTMVFTLTVTDVGGLSTSEQCSVKVNDVTPPTIEGAVDQTAEATGPSGATVSFDVKATDNVDEHVEVICSADSGATFPLGTTAVTCSASDTAGNPASKTFNVEVRDTTPPVLTLPGNLTAVATGDSAAVVTYSASATDLVDGSVPVTCTPPSGSTFEVGPTEVSCSATDSHGNTGTGSFTVTVTYAFDGFFRPIDNLPIVNVAKAGSAIPVKFTLHGYQGLGIFYAGYPGSNTAACQVSDALDTVEETVTAGGSGLQYDPTTDQYIYVWKSEKTWAGKCRQLVVKLKDGTVYRANFNFTK